MIKNILMNQHYCGDLVQKGYRCGGNIKHGEIILCQQINCVRKRTHIIQSDFKELLQSFQDTDFMKTLLTKLDTKKKKFQNELYKTEEEIDSQKQKKLSIAICILRRQLQKRNWMN